MLSLHPPSCQETIWAYTGVPKMAAAPGLLIVLVLWIGSVQSKSFDQLGVLTDSLLREVMARMGNDLTDQSEDYLDLERPNKQAMGRNRVAKEYDVHPDRFRPRHDNLLGREPSIRDQEYLEHSSLWGHQYVQGGAGEGSQRLKPDGSVKNLQVVKTDAVLPAYCNPPNPCPLGYTAEDGCLEDFSNTAMFSREYQTAQECMCDTEHMFDCPGSTQENEIDALARSIQNEGLMDSAINRIVQDMQIEGQHKNLVAKKFFNKKSHDQYYGRLRDSAKNVGRRAKRISSNPYLQGEKLPVVAKKAPKYSFS